MRISVEGIWLLTSCMETIKTYLRGLGGMVDSQTLHKVLLTMIVLWWHNKFFSSILLFIAELLYMICIVFMTSMFK